MARTFRRCWDKLGTKKTHQDLNPAWANNFEHYVPVEKFRYISDSPWSFDTSFLKKNDNDKRRACTRIILGKIKIDIDFADEAVISKTFDDPWCYD